MVFFGLPQTVQGDKISFMKGSEAIRKREEKSLKYLKEVAIIFGITMVGELLNKVIPLPVPAGVYGLFLLLGLLCGGVVKLSDICCTGELLLDLMPLMFIPAAVGLIERVEELKVILVPFLVITMVSTLFVMAVTGKMTEFVLKLQERRNR